MIAADHHTFVKNRTQQARCACGWKGQTTSDKVKSYKAHVRRSS